MGTGENNSSRSSYGGVGIYRSDDGGDSWRHMGLADTDRIGRIVIDPRDPNREGDYDNEAEIAAQEAAAAAAEKEA